VRFLVDAQLPPALARWLVSRGHDAEHVADRELAAADDRTIWRHAAATGAIIVTKDEDFALIRTMEQDGPSVLWIRLGNTRRQELLNWFERILPDALNALERGDSLIELS
jgi:predicted nuclease of predicted toxin-antitoxin system